MGTKNNPGAFDCYGNAEADEPMFILLARDACAPDTVLRWCELRLSMIRNGLKPPSDRAMIDEAAACAKAMTEWRRQNREATDLLMAPWTAEQVEALNAYQHLGYVHEFTCAHRDKNEHRDGGALVATTRGWICPYCDHYQNWAHRWMADKSLHPRNPIELLKTG